VNASSAHPRLFAYTRRLTCACVSALCLVCVFVLFATQVPRKGGPGITQSDLLVINKTDLAEAVGSDLKVL